MLVDLITVDRIKKTASNWASFFRKKNDHLRESCIVFNCTIVMSDVVVYRLICNIVENKNKTIKKYIITVNLLYVIIYK